MMLLKWVLFILLLILTSPVGLFLTCVGTWHHLICHSLGDDRSRSLRFIHFYWFLFIQSFIQFDKKMFHWTLVCIIFQLKNRFFFLSHLIWTWNNVPINERGLMDFSQLKQDQTKVQFFLRNPSLNDLLGFFCQTGGVSVRDIRKFSHRPTSNSCRAHLGTFHKICPVNSIYWYIFIAPPSICNIHSIYVSSTW